MACLAAGVGDMTDISNVSVSELRTALSAWRTVKGANQSTFDRIEDLIAEIERLRAVSARVEELEATRIRMLNQRLSGQWRDEIFEEGRLQGLDEALKVTIPSTSWGTEGLPQKWAEAIDALKEQSND